MKEHPILFTADMVRAILDGRKSQTRRIIKPQPWECRYRDHSGAPCGELTNKEPFWRNAEGECEHHRLESLCPYGQVGGLLYVKEAWRVAECYDDKNGTELEGILSRRNVQYEAYGDKFLGVVEGRYRHARFMPRWASRLTLRITEIRVERVQDISEADAVDEGIRGRVLYADTPVQHTVWYAGEYSSDVDIADSQEGAYAHLWDSINGKKPGCSWADNPWVWVIGFERVEVTR